MILNHGVTQLLESNTPFSSKSPSSFISAIRKIINWSNKIKQNWKLLSKLL